jgi:uncharacterized protein (UPF0332 family)
LSNKWIKKHSSTKQEIANLFAIIDRDIEQSQTPGLGPEWRFDIAYNSVIQSATAALAAAGYQAERANKHMRVLESLEFTIELDRKRIDFFDKCRRKRNTAVYEQTGVVSDHEADEMIRQAKELRQQVEDWISTEHPGLMS